MPLRSDGKGAASSTSPVTWSTYAQARASRVGAGLGFVLSGDGIVCVDLDHCIVDGHPVGWARELLDLCPPTYVELSQSGRGLHIWGYGHVGAGRVIRGDLTAEVYGRGRYIALGTRFDDAPNQLADITTLLDQLCNARRST